MCQDSKKVNKLVAKAMATYHQRIKDGIFQVHALNQFNAEIDEIFASQPNIQQDNRPFDSNEPIELLVMHVTGKMIIYSPHNEIRAVALVQSDVDAEVQLDTDHGKFFDVIDFEYIKDPKNTTLHQAQQQILELRIKELEDDAKQYQKTIKEIEQRKDEALGDLKSYREKLKQLIVHHNQTRAKSTEQ